MLVTGDVGADENWIQIGHLVVRKGDTTAFEARCIAREPAQFRSGETNRIGCSGDSGGELKWFDERW